MSEFITEHGLDLVTTLLGLIYIVLEYRASIALWIVGIIMPALDIYLYWTHGLYGDAGMALYFTLAAIYGYAVWKWGKKKGQTAQEEIPITHFPKTLIVQTSLIFLLVWAVTYYILRCYTQSDVPVLDALTNALSIVALWALARKYVEQWLFWIVVDVICTYLYLIKGLHFKAGLYALYVIIAVMGYRKWKEMAVKSKEI